MNKKTHISIQLPLHPYTPKNTGENHELVHNSLHEQSSRATIFGRCHWLALGSAFVSMDELILSLPLNSFNRNKNVKNKKYNYAHKFLFHLTPTEQRLPRHLFTRKLPNKEKEMGRYLLRTQMTSYFRWSSKARKGRKEGAVGAPI